MIDPTCRKELQGLASRPVLFDEPMARHASMGVGGPVDGFVRPADREELKGIVTFLREREIVFLPVGNCSNLIVRDGGFRGVLLSLEGLHRCGTAEESTDGAIIGVEAGVPLSRAVEFAAGEGLSGLEFCAGIPGSIGGGIKMNAGAWGKELKDVVTSIAVLNGQGCERSMPRDELAFEYRNLPLTEGSIILGAEIRLQRDLPREIRARVREYLGRRRDRHPLEYRSAGSIFKNPRDNPAGRLIEAAGLKGFTIGGAKISEKHANFIVNMGDACARDVTDLIERVQRRIYDEQGVVLQPEVKIIGDEGFQTDH